MEETLLEFIRIELMNIKGLLEIKVEKLPKNQRLFIYKRIKRLGDSIKIIKVFQLLEFKIKARIKELEDHARTLKSQSRHTPRRLAKELNWVLEEKDRLI